MDLNSYTNYYVFESDSKKFLFDIYLMECVEIPEKIYKPLLLKDAQLLDSEARKTIEYLKRADVFFENHRPDLSMLNNKKIYLSLVPETRCNLRCKYCFAEYGNNNKGKRKEFDFDLIRKTADYFVNQFENINDFRMDFVSGGEPLLNVQRLEKVLSVFRDTFKYKNLEIFLCTNGTLLTEKASKMLDKYNVNLGISIDGPKEYHDKCRLYRDGSGTYDDLSVNLEKLKNNKMLSRHLKSIWSLSVITSNTNDMTEIVKHNREMGFSNVQMKFVRLNKDNNLSINMDNIQKIYKMISDLLDFFSEKIEDGKLDDALFFVNENDYCGKIIKRLLLKEVFVYRCHAGREKFAVTPTGDIYPCDSFVGIKEYVIGNVYCDKRPDVRFADTDVDHRIKCKDCWCRYVCAGDCLHNSLCVNGNVYESDEVFCDIMKYTIKNTLVKIHELEKNAITELDKVRHLLRVRYSLNRV